jgi:phage antirepressor YoqD-like protein
VSNLVKHTSITSLQLVDEINIFRKEEGNRSEVRHADLLKVIRDEFEEEIGQGKISHTPYIHPQNGQTYEMYELTKTQATQVLVRESKFVRKAVVAKLEKMDATQTPKPDLASLSRLDILQMAIESETERLRLEAENKKLAPKAEVVDIILTAKNCYTTTDIAKELGMGPQTLNKKLCEMRIQRKFQDHYVLYAKYQDKGYTETKTELIQPKNKDPFTVLQMVWTQKGRLFIHSKMNPKLSFYNPQQQIATA